MIKIIFNIGLIFLSLSCAKENYHDPKKTGIIENSTKVTIDKTSQIDLKFSEIESIRLDTTLLFKDNIRDSLQEHIKTIRQKGNYKGLSVAIGVPNKGFWKSAIGESGTDIPLSTNTMFHALSLGKIFTAAIILKLAEEGLLNLNDTVNKWFPGCPRGNEITINHLLKHTSGLQTYEALYEFVLNDKNNFSEEEMLEMAFEYEIQDPPNSYISYSNTGYIMLGVIISRVTGKNLKDIFNEYFITALGLKNTVICDKENIMMRNVRGYNNNEISNKNEWPLTYATGPLISTPTDIIILYNYLLSGQFLSKASMDLMFSGMNIWKYDPDTYYGKGIYLIKDVPSGNYLGHGGGDGDFRTCVFYNIEKNVFVSVFSNTNASPIEPAMFSICEKIIHLID